ncbi:hypothetical protein A2276_04390 [candidate division WOR-1 bacterium RIFOXYA12_FULL_43_27]|uniref:Uncharacterized protein n=1 Tax=candidate division WOR-1 bacterium RIFOXYC2_FULL_46_14 TaxID=1802587 RepID=A0A1F4U448_UNCSA|nr:MAG: hypothetical protein A2276_04390 [candidate division WOR-1 bacterium RIFOXYA12_FULL_43_27]OGC18932.1 MAG: hypothetical protein A2292_08445 [candidate division WOR-1 bacterium RIFOXYB2_FULL_46_45]OGC29073.1 MAG: hypothetical protein A2232_03510 [candidate division WOR-1 bacterium RIFOXYA2_FULL_46_56]OGC39692.1 MAG: hypothetical protein A2438_06900 [candidate division WOR-1 bacterium RIFOXYC2_FULL_46_14]
MRIGERFPIPQICRRTGLSADYNNEISLRLTWLRSGYREDLDLFKEFKMKTYSERYPDSTYERHFAPKELIRIRQLDKIANIVNILSRDVVVNRVELKKYLRKAFQILNGITTEHYQTLHCGF